MVLSYKSLRTCAINHIQFQVCFVPSTVHLLFAPLTLRLFFLQFVLCSPVHFYLFPTLLDPTQKCNWSNIKMGQGHRSVHKGPTENLGWVVVCYTVYFFYCSIQIYLLENIIHTITDPKQILIIFSVNLF